MGLLRGCYAGDFGLEFVVELDIDLGELFVVLCQTTDIG